MAQETALFLLVAVLPLGRPHPGPGVLNVQCPTHSTHCHTFFLFCIELARPTVFLPHSSSFSKPLEGRSYPHPKAFEACEGPAIQKFRNTGKCDVRCLRVKFPSFPLLLFTLFIQALTSLTLSASALRAVLVSTYFKLSLVNHSKISY